jgi:peptidoglycan/xylan/chitin deacetylase (PgdA/CDA1 family)
MSTEFSAPQRDERPRDLVGYGRHVPRVTWPGGARVAVSLCLNYEEGSERSFAAGDGEHEAGAETGSQVAAELRDLALESMFEYGSRAGIFRLLRLFDRYKIRCTAFASAVALAANPQVAEWLAEAGHEVCSHGYRWSRQWTMSREEERESIQLALALFERVCGARPVGWYSRYAPSVNTRELLVEAGFLYDSDAYNDDLPYYVKVGEKDHLVIPYSFTYNDGRYPSGHWGGPNDFLDNARRALDYLWEEGATHPRMMSIGLHARFAGQASRAAGLAEFVEYAQKRGGVWFARRDEIARWWSEHHLSFERT